MSKISIIGAGMTGSATAQILSMQSSADLVLLDNSLGKAQGKCLDLLQSGPILNKQIKLKGTSDYKDTANSDIVIITAGLPRKPGMTREDLLGINSKIVSDVVQNTIHVSPEAIYIVLTNPLDTMAYLAKELGGIPKNRIIGQSGILDSARMSYFASKESGIGIDKISTVVFGGHGDEMVPLTRLSTIKGICFDKFFKPNQIEQIVYKTKNAGGEIVNLLKEGSAYFAPGAACALMAESILNDSKNILPCSAYLDGEYGLNDIFFGVPVRLGKGGIEEIVEYELTEDEKLLINKSAISVTKSISEIKNLIAK
jgi:malate dehydrogenase